MADESLEELVLRRIREQLGEGEGGLQRLIKARHLLEPEVQRIEVGLSGSGELRVEARPVTADASGEVTLPGDALAVIESASPALADDVRSRSPQDITLVVTLWTAVVQTLEFLVVLFQVVHGQPPTPVQINQIFNQTTNIYNQTINTVINMPPPGHG